MHTVILYMISTVFASKKHRKNTSDATEHRTCKKTYVKFALLKKHRNLIFKKINNLTKETFTTKSMKEPTKLVYYFFERFYPAREVIKSLIEVIYTSYESDLLKSSS